MARPSSYPIELRKRAVRMVAEVHGDYPNESAALRAVAQLGIGSAETLRNWVKRDEVDSGQRPGTTTEESAQIKAMKKEIAELKRANDILKAAAPGAGDDGSNIAAILEIARVLKTGAQLRSDIEILFAELICCLKTRRDAFFRHGSEAGRSTPVDQPTDPAGSPRCSARPRPPGGRRSSPVAAPTAVR